MASEFLALRRLNSLRPTDEAGEEILRRIPADAILSVRISRPRNPRHHAKFFAMLGLILKNQDHYKSIDELLDVCKLQIGHCKTIQTRRGPERTPLSISFAAMDQTQFDGFYDRAVDWVLTDVIPGLRRAELDAEVAAELLQFAE